MTRSVSAVVWLHAHSTYSKRIDRGVKPAPTLLEPLTYACVHVCSCRYRLGAATVQRVLMGMVHGWAPLPQFCELHISISGVGVRSCVCGSRRSVA